MAAVLAKAGFLTADALLAFYDERTKNAFVRLKDLLRDDDAKADAEHEVAEAGRVAAQGWARMRTTGGTRRPLESASAVARNTAEEEDARQGDRAAGGLVADAGLEDSEHPASLAGGDSTTKAQRRLCSLLDVAVTQELEARLKRQGRDADLRRLAELRDDNVNHDWLWCLHSAHNRPLSEAEFVAAVRLRLGCAGPSEPAACALCGGTLDSSGAHALCCAKGECSKGHNGIRDVLHKACLAADPVAEREPLHLLEAHPALRPADVLTSAAIPGCLAALDVGVMAPEASGAGKDCCAALRRRKLHEHEPYEDAMRKAGLSYVPLAWSGFGRPHAVTHTVLGNIARQAARRRGGSDATVLRRRTAASIGLEIARRGARMAMACLPGGEEEEEEEVQEADSW
jgi:hypothetical protein